MHERFARAGCGLSLSISVSFSLLVALSRAPASAAPKAAKAKPAQQVAPWQHSYVAEEPTCPDDGRPLPFEVPPPPKEERALEIVSSSDQCAGLPSVEALCSCLQTRAKPTCELVKGQGKKSEQLGELAILQMHYKLPELPDPVHPQYLVRRVGGKWSAMTAVSGRRQASTHLEELPMSTGVLLVARTKGQSQEPAREGIRTSGSEQISFCLLAASEKGGGTCYRALTLADWSFTSSGEQKCLNPWHSAYRLRIDSTGKIVVEHVSGKDMGRAKKVHL